MRGLDEARVIRLNTLNIFSGRAGRLEAALRALKQGNLDVGVVQETKIIDGIHARQGAGYDIWAPEA